MLADNIAHIRRDGLIKEDYYLLESLLTEMMLQIEGPQPKSRTVGSPTHMYNQPMKRHIRPDGSFSIELWSRRV